MKQIWVWKLGPMALLVLGMQIPPNPWCPLTSFEAGVLGSELIHGHNCYLIFEKPFEWLMSLEQETQAQGKGMPHGSFLSAWAGICPGRWQGGNLSRRRGAGLELSQGGAQLQEREGERETG